MYAIPMNYEAYIRHKGLPFVVSADKSHPQGLFSSDIFGVTEDERSRKSALISLNCPVMRPLVLNLMKRINRKIVTIATTRCEAFIRKGIIGIVDDKYVPEEGDIRGESGPAFLFKNWKHLDKKQFEAIGGKFSNIEMKRCLTKLNEPEIFESYVYVIPIGFREEEQDTIMINNDINVLYSDIIRYAQLIGSGGEGLDVNMLQIQLQNKVLEHGEYIIDRYLGPKGVGRKQIMSRSIDNSSRMVILTQKYKSDELGKSKVRLGGAGIPFHHLISMFRDTVLKFSQDLINELFARGYFPEETTQDLLIFYDTTYMSDAIEKMEDFYQRTAPFPAVKPDGTFGVVNVEMEVRNGDKWETITKPLTWIEFFYIVLNGYADIYNTRYTMDTRYPVDSCLSTQFLRPHALTLKEELLKDVKVLNFHFEDDFPLVDEDVLAMKNVKIFEQGSRVSAATVVGWNGDHDRLPVH